MLKVFKNIFKLSINYPTQSVLQISRQMTELYEKGLSDLKAFETKLPNIKSLSISQQQSLYIHSLKEINASEAEGLCKIIQDSISLDQLPLTSATISMRYIDIIDEDENQLRQLTQQTNQKIDLIQSLRLRSELRAQLQECIGKYKMKWFSGSTQSLTNLASSFQTSINSYSEFLEQQSSMSPEEFSFGIQYYLRLILQTGAKVFHVYFITLQDYQKSWQIVEVVKQILEATPEKQIMNSPYYFAFCAYSYPFICMQEQMNKEVLIPRLQSLKQGCSQYISKHFETTSVSNIMTMSVVYPTVFMYYSPFEVQERQDTSKKVNEAIEIALNSIPGNRRREYVKNYVKGLFDRSNLHTAIFS